YACYQLVSSGLGPVAQPLGAQLADCAARRPEAPELRPAMAFACHLHILEALGGEAVPAWMENESAWPAPREARPDFGHVAADGESRLPALGLEHGSERSLGAPSRSLRAPGGSAPPAFAFERARTPAARRVCVLESSVPWSAAAPPRCQFTCVCRRLAARS